jgi:hypothetical protein
MKKFSKVILIIATACLAVGIVMTTLALMLTSFDFKALSLSGEYRQEGVTIDVSTVTSIVYEGVSHDVVVERTDSGDALALTYWYNDRQSYEHDYTGSTLRIEEKYQFQLFSFDLDFSNHTTILRIPKSFDGSLSLTTSSGNIKVYRLAPVDELTVKTTSGTLDISEVEVADRLRVESVSGNIALADISAARGVLHTTSGTSTLDELRFDAEFEAKSVSGKIGFERLQASRLTFESTSGDVRGTLVGDPADYAIESHTTSGRVSLPRGGSNAGTGAARGSLVIKTISGDMDIEFVAGR